MGTEIQSAKEVAGREAEEQWSPGKVAGLLSAVRPTLPTALGAEAADHATPLSSLWWP